MRSIQFSKVAHEVGYEFVNDQGDRSVTHADDDQAIFHGDGFDNLLHAPADINRLDPVVGLELERFHT